MATTPDIYGRLAAELKVYTGHEMTARDFALLIEKMFPGRSGILYGCGLNIKDSSSNIVHVANGWLTIRGRVVEVNEGDITITLPTESKTFYIYAAVRLSDANNLACIEVSDQFMSDTATFNQSGTGTAYFKMATITAQSNGLSNLKIVAETIPDQPTIRTGTSAPTSSTPGKDGDIYIQYTA